MRKLALLFLCMVSTIHANPYSNDKIQSDVMKYIATVAPTLYMLNACQSEIYIPTLNYSIEQTYKIAFVYDTKDKFMVDSIWGAHEYQVDERLRSSLFLITQGLRNEETRDEVIEACAVLTKTVKNRFHWLYHIMDTRSYK